ncbi:hypothetical protein NADFUDRAFT_45352 [Nadsonia fulvescens var. elongata DSM 6958]|uniref:Inclusion body clearance protein IML2 n=1 Tax=Nadsonia fulvescens var. elongata DSM 6958 TaxID=857566 RepID=A0A1E3PPC9_9ASCO|nr:hypothetical protein NADFUDRAFT_45352 [Nadsonia fulvescens var. elongata DSM 6958]
MATSQHYAPGLEFQLTYAEAQLMGAVCMFLSEGVIDAAKGLLKLRKAFLTLDEISQKIKQKPKAAVSSPASPSQSHSESSFRLDMDTLGKDFQALGLQLSDDQEVNVRAEELYLARLRRKLGAAGTVEQAKRLLTNARGDTEIDMDPSLLSSPSTTTLASAKSFKSISTSASAPKSTSTPTTSTTTLSTDEFIESGVNLCYGVLQLIIAVIPPSLSSALSFVGFHGSKVDGLKMLWQATEYRNIHGAIATLVLLLFYDGPTQLSDITLEDDNINNEIITATGHPIKRLERVLKQVREDFPNSALWLLQEARAMASQGHLTQAISLLDTIDSTKIEMRQIEALLLFDKTMMTIFLHNYETTSDNFIRLIAINSWSHALYTYIAGICLVEVYRALRVTDPVKANDAKRRAREYIEKAPTLMGKKRFMAKTMPFDVFLTRKVRQWHSVAQARGIDIVDAIGTSPIHEIIYFWNGFKSMPDSALDKSLEMLNYSTTPEAQKMAPETQDEALIRYTLNSIVLRSYKSQQPERTVEGLKMLDDNVLPHIYTTTADNKIVYNKSHGDPWVGPVSIYERAVFEWKIKGRKGITAVKYYLKAANNWADDYELSTRVGMKIKSATERIESL